MSYWDRSHGITPGSTASENADLREARKRIRLLEQENEVLRRAVDGIPVAVTCRVLNIARQPYYRWRADPVTAAEQGEAYRASALFDAHREDPEFGYRFLADGARGAGESMVDRTSVADLFG